MYSKIMSSSKQQNLETHWLKRMGLAGFAFFFLKGMLWLIIPWLAHTAVF